MMTDLLAVARRQRAPPVLPLAACLLAACALPAATIGAPVASIVTNCDDAGAGSLRNAITIADDPAIIDMTALACSTITLTTGAIVTTITNIALNGPTDHALTISGSHLDRVFVHQGAAGAGRTLALDHLNITDGAATSAFEEYGDGGCIFAASNLTMQNSTVSNCAANGSIHSKGGGVHVHRNLILNDSVISGNQASSFGATVDGGGVYVYGTLTANRATIRDNVALSGGLSIGGGLYVNGTVQTYATTISGNQAQYAAGLYAAGNATVQNSTVSGNTATTGAGGMKVHGILTLDNSTVAFNTQGRAGYGAGLVLVNGGVANSSIIARNKPAPNGHYYDLLCTTGKTLTGSNNLINGADCIIPGLIIFGDPLLAPLANNGGPTKTHALGAGSPAIDAGLNPHDFVFDQRLDGHARVVGNAADVGAFEFNDRIFSDGFD